MKRRVDLLITDLDFGGAERVVVDLAIGLQSRDWQVRVISLMVAVAHVDELTAAGVQFETLGLTTKKKCISAFFRLLKLLRRDAPDILHAHLFHAVIFARLASVFVHCISISSTHSIYEKGRFRPFFYRVTDRLCHYASNVSNFAVEHYIKIGAVKSSKLFCMYNGVDTSKFSRLLTEKKRKDTFCWLAVGRFEFQKDYPVLIDAVRAIRPSYDFSLSIVGEGKLRGELQEMIDNYGLDDIVFLPGVSDNIPGYMENSDAFVLSSRCESFGLVVAEAMSSGLPVVVTDSGGPKEIVAGSQAGVVVPVGDSARLADAMTGLMDQSETQRLEMGKRGREWIINNFSTGKMISRWEAVYKEFLS